MDAIRSYRDLDVWRVSMELATGVYRLTDGIPARALWPDLADPAGRSSIPANLAEGHGRPSQAYRITSASRSVRRQSSRRFSNSRAA